LVNKYEVLGLTRSGLIYERELSLTNNIKSNSQFSGIVTCLLLGFRKDWDVNLYGEVGNSWSSIINFCKDIKKLADVLNNKYFIIKFKNIENTEIISAINKIISKSNNLVLTTEHNVTSVELISNSQFVIGKYSTIMDEALIAGKNVLIHDPENFVSTFGFYRKNKFLIANNFEDLLFKTNSILDGKNQFSKHYEEEKNLYVKNYLTDNGIIGSQKKIMELLENYIK
jgi:UDP-N-acetylglucosamine 2-epimerase